MLSSNLSDVPFYDESSSGDDYFSDEEMLVSDEEMLGSPTWHCFSTLTAPIQIKKLSYVNTTFSRFAWIQTAGMTTLFVMGAIGIGAGLLTICAVSSHIPSFLVFLQTLQGAGSLGTIGILSLGGLSTAGGTAWILGNMISYHRKYSIPTMRDKKARQVGGTLKSETDFFLYRNEKTQILFKVGRTKKGEVYREPIIPQLNENQVRQMKEELIKAKQGEFVYQTLQGIEEFLSIEELQDLKNSDEGIEGFLESVIEMTPEEAKESIQAFTDNNRTLIYRSSKDKLIYGIARENLIEKPIGSGLVYLVKFNVDQDNEKIDQLEEYELLLLSHQDAKKTLNESENDELDEITVQIAGLNQREFFGFYYINEEDGQIYSIVKTEEMSSEVIDLSMKETYKEEKDALDHFISCLNGKTKNEINLLQTQLLSEGKWEKFSIFRKKILENKDTTASSLLEARSLCGGRQGLRRILSLQDEEDFQEFSTELFKCLPKEGVVIAPPIEIGEIDRERQEELKKKETSTPYTLFTPDTPSNVQRFINRVQQKRIEVLKKQKGRINAAATDRELVETKKDILDQKKMARRCIEDFSLRQGQYPLYRLKQLKKIGRTPPPFYEIACERFTQVYERGEPDSLAQAKATTTLIKSMYDQAIQYINAHSGSLEILERTAFANVDGEEKLTFRRQLLEAGLFPRYKLEVGEQTAYFSQVFKNSNQIYLIAYVEVESGKFIPRLLQRGEILWKTILNEKESQGDLHYRLSDRIDRLCVNMLQVPSKDESEDIYAEKKLINVVSFFASSKKFGAEDVEKEIKNEPHHTSESPLLSFSRLQSRILGVGGKMKTSNVKFSGRVKDFPSLRDLLYERPQVSEIDDANTKLDYIYCAGLSDKYTFCIEHRYQPNALMRQDEIVVHAYEADIQINTFLMNKRQVVVSKAQTQAILNAIKGRKIKRNLDDVKFLRHDEAELLTLAFKKENEYFAYKNASNEVVLLRTFREKENDLLQIEVMNDDPTTTNNSNNLVQLSHQQLGKRIIKDNINIIKFSKSTGIDKYVDKLQKAGDYFLFKDETPASTAPGAFLPGIWAAVRTSKGEIIRLPYDQLKNVKVDSYHLFGAKDFDHSVLKG
ncbi:MAG: hypothetical protein KDK55_04800 [Chlamydiia bacterium]|nr:hypothetical protein [Chlamydiia bacterium]